jgi:hypothetical protein
MVGEYGDITGSMGNIYDTTSIYTGLYAGVEGGGIETTHVTPFYHTGPGFEIKPTYFSNGLFGDRLFNSVNQYIYNNYYDYNTWNDPSTGGVEYSSSSGGGWNSGGQSGTCDENVCYL